MCGDIEQCWTLCVVTFETEMTPDQQTNKIFLNCNQRQKGGKVEDQQVMIWGCRIKKKQKKSKYIFHKRGWKQTRGRKKGSFGFSISSFGCVLCSGGGGREGGRERERARERERERGQEDSASQLFYSALLLRVLLTLFFTPTAGESTVSSCDGGAAADDFLRERGVTGAAAAA